MNRKKILNQTFALLFFFAISNSIYAQDPPSDPPPLPGHGQSGNQPPGGGTPIGSGLILLVAMGLGYGLKKYNDNKREQDI